MTIAKLLQNSPVEKGIGEKIFCALLDFKPENLFLKKDEFCVTVEIVNKFKNIERKILKGTPLQYALNSAEFLGRKFYVDRNVLIPRFETENLVAQAIEFYVSSGRIKDTVNIIDVGTGSGCIAISLASEIAESRIKNKKIKVFATDISKAALEVARKNAKTYNANVEFLKSDLLQNPKLPHQFDLICANLPYLTTDYLEKLPKKLANNLKSEPSLALDGGRFGLDLIKALLKQLPDRLRSAGIAILEIDPRQTKALEKFCQTNLPSWRYQFIKDLTGQNRFFILKPSILE